MMTEDFINELKLLKLMNQHHINKEQLKTLSCIFGEEITAQQYWGNLITHGKNSQFAIDNLINKLEKLR